MNKKLNSTYLITLAIVIGVNILFSTHFLALFLIGVVFKIFLTVIEKEEYYMLLAVIGTFLFIEVVQGFHLFSLTIISIIIYYFVLTRIKHLLSSSILSEFVYILLFYLIVFILHNINNMQIDQVLLFIYNFLIDSIIIGLFL